MTDQVEDILRRLAAGDETALTPVLALSRAECGDGAEDGTPGSGLALGMQTRLLVRLAALLAVGAPTDSLRWAVDLATANGVRDEEIVEVLIAVAPAVGAARVVSAAPRLALAIGYDIESSDWDEH